MDRLANPMMRVLRAPALQGANLSAAQAPQLNTSRSPPLLPRANQARNSEPVNPLPLHTLHRRPHLPQLHHQRPIIAQVTTPILVMSEVSGSVMLVFHELVAHGRKKRMRRYSRGWKSFTRLRKYVPSRTLSDTSRTNGPLTDFQILTRLLVYNPACSFGPRLPNGMARKAQ